MAVAHDSCHPIWGWKAAPDWAPGISLSEPITIGQTSTLQMLQLPKHSHAWPRFSCNIDSTKGDLDLANGSQKSPRMIQYWELLNIWLSRFYLMFKITQHQIITQQRLRNTENTTLNPSPELAGHRPLGGFRFVITGYPQSSSIGFSMNFSPSEK